MSEKGNRLTTESYKGVRDFYPEDMFVQKYIFAIWKKTVESFGYLEYNASILEPSELYKAKSGEEIINEQTYTFTDRGDREVTLRPEMTPTVARMVAAKRRELSFPLRWYSIPNLFRYERPQRGRLREHWQLNADIFGIENSQAEVEMITMASQLMKNLGALESDFCIKISSRKLLNAIFNNWHELDEKASSALQKLIDRKAKLPEEVFYQEAEKIVGEPFTFLDLHIDTEESRQALGIPQIREAKEELDAVIAELRSIGITNVVLDQELIRGFDYYTGIIFEVFDTNPENNRSLFGGGRYDNLLSLFGNDQMAAVGFGMGDVTILNFLESRNLVPAYVSTVNLYIATLSKDFHKAATELATTLRAEGVNVAVDYSGRKVSDQFKKADKDTIPFVLCVGDTEVETKEYKIKSLASGDETPVKEKEISTFITYKLNEKPKE